jgi:hypothetical protein
MDPKVLTVYKSPFEKKRIGRKYDGGYVTCMIPDIKYDVILAGGINDDISFEEEFLKLYPETDCYAFDGTINGIKTSNKKIQFIKKNIDHFNDDKTTNLHDLIDKYENIFIKMDIEFFEIPWIKSLSNEQLQKFSQIVIEFHFPYNEKEIEVFNKLNMNHVLVHFHANNCCGTRVHNRVVMPNVFECTYIHKKFMNEPYELNTDNVPSPIDMRNLIQNPEICLNHYPFKN